MDFYSYEKSLPASKKKALGIIYTPPEIVNYINTKLLDSWKAPHPPRVIDFSCGTGVFLHDMAEKIATRYDISYGDVIAKYIYGADIDRRAAQICRDLLGSSNIECANGLHVDLDLYDMVVGNPPYVRIQNLDASTRSELESFDWCTGDTDLYIAFLQKIMTSKCHYGIICPNSWLHTHAGSCVRQDFLSAQRAVELVDFRIKQVFKGVGAYCSIMIATNQKNSSYVFKIDTDARAENKSYNSIDTDTFFLYDEEVKLVNRMSLKKNNFLDHFDVKVGIATLADKVYFLQDCQEDGDHYITTKDGAPIKIEKEITRRCYKASKLSQYSGSRTDVIIFPYDKTRHPIPEHVFKTKYPQAYSYLARHKTTLLNRDKGKFGELHAEGSAEWYEYGRSQGLRLQDKKILLSTLDKTLRHKKIRDGLFISGYCVIPKDEGDYDLISEILVDPDSEKLLSLKGKPMGGGYYGISKKFFKHLRFDIPQEEKA